METTSHYNIVSGDSDRKFGPYSLEEIAAMLASREVSLGTWCIRVGDGEMVSVAELFPGRGASELDREREEEIEAGDSGEDEDEDEEASEQIECEDGEEELEQVPWEDGVWYAEDDEEETYEDDKRGAASDGPVVDLDETIIRMHPSIFGYPKTLLLTVACGLLAGMSLILSGVVGTTEPFRMLTWGAAIVGVLSFGLLLLSRTFDNYFVTRARVEVVRGIIAKSSNEVRVSDVRRIDVDKRGLLGLLNVGDVKLSSAGTGGFDVVFRDVRGAHRIKKIIRRVQKDPYSTKRFLVTGSKRWQR